MQYYVSLDEQEFRLDLVEPGAPRQHRVRGAEGELHVEVLAPPAEGRPALLLVDGVVCRVLAAAGGRSAGAERALINGRSVGLRVESELERRARPNRNIAARSVSQVFAPMPGRVVKVNVRVGDEVVAGAPLLGIEAMKMENELLAPGSGTIAAVHVSVGSTVEADQELIVIEPA